MKIEKRKVTEAKPLSVAAKSAMGVMLGMTTAATFIACGGPVGEISDAIDENSSSSNEIQAPKSDSSSPESSNQAETQQSSSEQSEAQQNSAEQTGAQQSGQEQTETKQSSSSQVVVDIPLSHEPISSSVMEALSAAAESDSSANNRCIAVPGSEITVCTQTPSSSSSSNAQSSSSSANNACTNVPGSDIIICPDQSLPHSSAMTSMVTTFEKTDIEV
ncbi:MAG: hypothetical protein IKN70_05265 [Fibrobacter sp.]|nr:hypothetical protein [Fibrobacter sp.]